MAGAPSLSSDARFGQCAPQAVGRVLEELPPAPERSQERPWAGGRALERLVQARQLRARDGCVRYELVGSEICLFGYCPACTRKEDVAAHG